MNSWRRCTPMGIVGGVAEDRNADWQRVLANTGAGLGRKHSCKAERTSWCSWGLPTPRKLNPHNISWGQDGPNPSFFITIKRLTQMQRCGQ